jgi:diadenosine tetraphosphate (Ap4A) HIT family hydrolase
MAEYICMNRRSFLSLHVLFFISLNQENYQVEVNNFDLFNTKFQVAEMHLSKNRSWTWSLRPVQATIGSGILSLNRYAESMSNLSPLEGEDLISMMGTIESVLKKTFNYQKMNYMMLMMVDPHIHFHVIPRYSDIINFEHIVFKDNGWPALPRLDDNKDSVSKEVILKLRDYIKTYV